MSMPIVRLELATPGLQASALAIKLYSSICYCWEAVEFIQLVYFIIMYTQFLNCDMLLIRDVQWFYWTQELLVPVEKFTVRMRMIKIELTTWTTKPLSYTAQFAIAEKELSLSSWCIASLYIYHLSTVIDFSSEKYRGSTGHRNSSYQQRNLQ